MRSLTLAVGLAALAGSAAFANNVAGPQRQQLSRAAAKPLGQLQTNSLRRALLNVRAGSSAASADGDLPAGESAAKDAASRLSGGEAAGGQLGFRQRLASLVPTPVERKKILPLAGIFFCCLFCYTILRDTKDVLVVTAPGGNAELIPFLKTYVNLPGAILFTVLYARLNNSLPPQAVFYTVITPFLAFFAAFGAFIYPARASLHPNAAADYLLSVVPKAFFPLVAIFRNWTYALFYTMAELWGSVVVSVLFWGFANEITTSKEAKKYYPLFGLGANVALIFSGQYVKYVSHVRAGLPDGVDKWGRSLQMLMGAVCAFGGLMVALYTYMQRSVLKDPEVAPTLSPASKTAKGKKSATSMGLVESAKYLASSPYIRNLALLVIAYGMSINIVEVTWKSKLKAQFPDPNDYSAFMGNFSTATGITTLIMMLAGRFIFTRFGWGTAALVTPTVLLITAAIFFSLILFGGAWAPIMAWAGTTPLMAAVLVGAAQNILSKSSKYSLFDPCKEMAYINLDAEQKTKGKAAIDVIGNPLGKSGGSFIQQILIVSMGSLAASTPYLAVILFGIIAMWLKAATSLDKLIKEKDSEVAKKLL
ncbi:plastidic ATP/ADP transporter [Tribonema minus]|uniref:ADP,ATP carrier protein n=1 Tax=Tribonema minus TaxID=303371 RepID=A0A835YI30_9STRA|nr:plastidic ATP/ADP transporter [Tribonema minus]